MWGNLVEYSELWDRKEVRNIGLESSIVIIVTS